MVMGVRDMDQFLELWEMDVPGVRRRMILAPVPRERERWYALWLLTQGWTAQATAEALERDPHTIGRWLAAFGEGGPTALIFEQSGDAPPPSKRRSSCPPTQASNWPTGKWSASTSPSASVSA